MITKDLQITANWCGEKVQIIQKLPVTTPGIMRDETPEVAYLVIDGKGVKRRIFESALDIPPIRASQAKNW